MTERSLTSIILFFWGSLTLPAKQQREMALWIMNLLDLKLGSLYSLGPGVKEYRDAKQISDITKSEAKLIQLKEAPDILYQRSP